MSERILIETIRIDRALDEGEDFEALAKDLRDNKQQVPVLLLDDRTLVDGLRRIHALTLLGHKTVQAVVATSLEEACENLALAHTAGPPSTRRIWAMWIALTDLMNERTYRVRTAANRRGADGKRLGRSERIKDQSRPMFIRAFGNYTAFEPMRFVYRWAEEGHPEAGKIIAGLEAGEYTATTARGKILEIRKREAGTVTSADEQKQIMTQASRQIKTALSAFDQIKAPIRVPEKEFDAIMAEMKRNRSSLYRLARLLEEAEKTHE